MKILIDREKETVLAAHARCASNALSRAIGLVGLREMAGFDALVIPSCRSVHMFGMRFAIDVLFCNGENRVVHLIESLRPWRCTRYVRTARYVIELPVGTVQRLSIKRGELLRLQ